MTSFTASKATAARLNYALFLGVAYFMMPVARLADVLWGLVLVHM